MLKVDNHITHLRCGVLRTYRYFFSLLLLLSACTTVYKGSGDALIGYTKSHGVPYLLATNDVFLGCSMATSFTPFLLSFSRLTTAPDKLAILLYLMAGNCAEFKAWQEELRYLRALHNQNAVAAQDARIAQQRYLNRATQRQFNGYRYLGVAYAEPGGVCPTLDTHNEFYWLLGLISGLQALLNDMATVGSHHIPLDSGTKIGRATACLDNKKWWGIPHAIRATLWIVIPGYDRAGRNKMDKTPEQILHTALQMGGQQGIKISYVLAAQVYWGLGDIAKVKQIIRDHSSQTTTVSDSAHHSYQLLNQIATLQIQQFSDRLWTEATGKRTPIGRLGSFWDDPIEDIDMIEIDDVL